MGGACQEFRISDCELRKHDFGFRIADFGNMISDFELRKHDFEFRIANFGFDAWTKKSLSRGRSGHEFRISDCGNMISDLTLDWRLRG
jgi:hypothetical protein